MKAVDMADQQVSSSPRKVELSTVLDKRKIGRGGNSERYGAFGIVDRLRYLPIEARRGAMTVSVIIPVFNVPDIVARAIDSVMKQTLQPLEIIVVDDCSTDDTVAAIERLNNPLVRIVSTPKNVGCGPARNIGFKIAKGEWLALLDADDAWLPERLERLTAVGQSTGADFVADNVILWDAIADRQVRIGLDLPKPVNEITTIEFFRNDHNFNFSNMSWALLKPLMRRSFIEAKNIYYHEELHQGQGDDFVLYANLLFNGAKAVVTSDAYYLYSLPTAPSGKSPHTRSKHNFHRILEAHDELAEKYKDRIDPELAKVMTERRNVVKLVHQANVAKQHRIAKEYLQYALYVGTKPDLVRGLFFRSLHKVQARLTGAER
jgi:succinoglycan biosynthesis protein ExoO